MAADERIIEPHVVRHKDAATQKFFQLVRNGFKRRCRLDHVVRNPSELRDVQWNGQAGVDERFPPFDFAVPSVMIAAISVMPWPLAWEPVVSISTMA